MRLIDGHQHFWDPARGDYGWLTPELGPIYRAFRPDDLQALLQDNGVSATILVQAAPTSEETDWLLDIARNTSFVAGVVGWIDLSASDAAARIADRAADPLFVGVRPMLQDMAKRDWILIPELIPALGALERAGLVFDALIHADQLHFVTQLAVRHPDLAIVLDHAAKPPLATGNLAEWQAGIARLAAQPNVACKLSGLLTEAAAGFDPMELAPLVDHLFACFGPDRLMWGSDWPVVELVTSYDRWSDAAKALVRAQDPAAIDGVFGLNAARIYGVKT